MTYIIADIHGCYDEYVELLNKISFSDEDMLYILGDTIDRGKKPLEVLRDIMSRPNVQLLMGNHELIMLIALKGMKNDMSEKSISGLAETELESFTAWLGDGGATTANQLARLSAEERKAIIDYVSAAKYYAELDANGKHYILAHAGPGALAKGNKPDAVTMLDFVLESPDYGRRCFEDTDTYLVTGHIPTPRIRQDKKPIVYEENGHIAIDCGCVYGGRLAAYCLETGEKTYVEKKV